MIVLNMIEVSERQLTWQETGSIVSVIILASLLLLALVLGIIYLAIRCALLSKNFSYVLNYYFYLTVAIVDSEPGICFFCLFSKTLLTF